MPGCLDLEGDRQDRYHPTQILADFLTTRETSSQALSNVKSVFVGDARNKMANTLNDRRGEGRYAVCLP